MLFDSFMLYLVEVDYEETFEPNYDPDQYRTSSMPYCNRKSYFIKTGHENFSSNYILRTAREGRQHHRLTQEDAKKYAEKILGLEVEIEFPIETTFTPLMKGKPDKPITVRGSIDLLWELPNQQLELVDVKSVSSKAFYNTRTYGAYQSHIDQGLGYNWGFEKTHKPIKKILLDLWYKNRNDGQWHETKVPHNKERTDFLVQKTCKLAHAVRNKYIPDDHSPMYDYECQSKSGQCPFYSLCYEGKKFKYYEEKDKNKEGD